MFVSLKKGENLSKNQKKSVIKSAQGVHVGKFSCAPTAKTEEQKQYLRLIHENQITFSYGPPGSGKTFIATSYGLNEVLRGKYDRLIITRPCVEAYGESLGYLPGTSKEKILPYILPILNIMKQKVDGSYIDNLIKDEIIQIIPFAFLRGWTFDRSFVIADEVQNTVQQQVRLLLTRIGENSKIVCTGDINQSDLGAENGLTDAIDRLNGVEGIGIMKLTEDSIVRNPIIKEIERRYSSK